MRIVFLTMTTTRLSNFALAIFALTLVAPSSASATQSDQLPRNEVIEKIVCKADAQQSYSLYLPADYTPRKKWPIIYAFDPGARGKLTVNLFKEAAAKYGFIVAGSNNSRNGIQVSDIVKALWVDTHERFSIDERRVYTAGFSGGARVAFAVGLIYRVAGVIACSGGFPRAEAPSPSTPFVIFGTAGTDDFNFPEMQQLRRKLDAAGVRNRLAIFDGGHDWAPANLCAEAVAWMELEAMKAGFRVKDDILIDELFNGQLKEARTLEAANQLYSGYEKYDGIVAQFRGLRNVSEIEARTQTLRVSKEINAARKNERAEEEKQANRAAKLQSLIAQLPDPATSFSATAELKAAIRDLTRDSEMTEDLSRRRVARRVLQEIFVQSYEEANANYLKKNYEVIPAQLEIAAQLRPTDARVFYDLAVAYSRLGKKKQGLSALNRAIENGFADLAGIEQNQDFASLRSETGYQKVVMELRKRQSL